jgi:hypothetical protein
MCNHALKLVNACKQGSRQPLSPRPRQRMPNLAARSDHHRHNNSERTLLGVETNHCVSGDAMRRELEVQKKMGHHHHPLDETASSYAACMQSTQHTQESVRGVQSLKITKGHGWRCRWEWLCTIVVGTQMAALTPQVGPSCTCHYSQGKEGGGWGCMTSRDPEASCP